MSNTAYNIDIQKMCDLKGSVYAYFIDTNNVFLACNKLLLDFFRDIFGRIDVIGNTPINLQDNLSSNEIFYLENEEIVKSGLPKQFYQTWVIRDLHRLELLTIKMPICDTEGKTIGVFTISQILNQFNVQKAFQLGLTKRETECLFYLAEGYTAKEMAQVLNLSPRTVEGYIENMKHKIGCLTTSELLMKIFESGVREDVRSTFNTPINLEKSNPISRSEKCNAIFASVSMNNLVQ